MGIQPQGGTARVLRKICKGDSITIVNKSLLINQNITVAHESYNSEDHLN